MCCDFFHGVAMMGKIVVWPPAEQITAVEASNMTDGLVTNGCKKLYQVSNR